MDNWLGLSGDRSRTTAIVLLAALLSMGLPASASAQHDREEHGPEQHSHGEAGDGHHAGLHFTHPLIAESISPDTKARLDHQFFEFPDGDQEHSGVLEAEYAFTRSFSIEAGIPFSYSASELGNAELLLKFANYAFEEFGLLLGYGVEFGFPTNGSPDEEEGEEAAESLVPAGLRAAGTRAEGGHGASLDPGFRFLVPQLSGGGAGVEGTLGTDEWEVAPFLNVGWKRGDIELIAWAIFGIPFNQPEQEEVATELSWNFSGMYHVSSRVQALLELDGSGGISGPAVGEDIVNVSPGLRLQLLPDRPLVFGGSVGFPVTEEDPFDVRFKASLFWHFPR